jgi:SagB-type dehydrogenase family enzyme
LRAPEKKRGRKIAASAVSARLNPRVRLEAQVDGTIAACLDDYSVGLGKFSAGAVDRAQALRAGLPLSSFSQHGSATDKEIDLLVHRLARRGLLEYWLAHSDHEKDQVVIEPQLPDYWPRTTKPNDTETIALSRFAYLRRRGNEMVLESPRAGALFRICDPRIASTLAALSTPRKISWLRRQDGFPGAELLALLLDCEILFKVDAASDDLRAAEGDDNLVMWDFHDLLFHARSTEGRQSNPLGGLYPFAGIISPLPAVRPPWPGKKIDLDAFSTATAAPNSPFTQLLQERHSTRDFDDAQPITLAELSRFLNRTARVQSNWTSRPDFDDHGPDIEYTTRRYPSGGSSYELELYLAVAQCEGLARGFYHYDAGGHALVAIETRPHELEAMLSTAAFAMGASAAPPILITIAARFGRVSWKYASIAHSLILKDAGVLIQTFYLMATDMGLGGCAIGTSNIDLFAKMTGIEFHVEGPVGQFALGRGSKLEGSE